MITPTFLKPNDTVAIVCTARKFFPEDAQTGNSINGILGLKSKIRNTIGLMFVS